MTDDATTIRIDADPTNPGQFFACCGLMELAARLWGESAGWFGARDFHIRSGGGLADLVDAVSRAKLTAIDPADATASPIEVGAPFRPLRLDWWRDNLAGGRELKVWAGSMESLRIARGMQHAMTGPQFRDAGLLDIGTVAYHPDDGKKVEPFYFDARRGPNSHSRDVGFSPNDLEMTTLAFPAVEFLCLVGLQRCLPARCDQPRVFRYYTWPEPLPPALIPAAASGAIPLAGRSGHRFENWYRTGQKKHKAFRPATPETPRGFR